MHEVQVNITQPAFVEGVLDGLGRSCWPAVRTEFGGEEDGGTRGVGAFAIVEDGPTALGFVFVPCCRVDVSISGLQNITKIFVRNGLSLGVSSSS
jgi:hypothetical protein